MNVWFQRVIFVAIIALFSARNLPWHLDDYDQAKQAYTSFEMVGQGHWWFQHTPAQSVATKPPLAGWISAALFYATRWWDGAWRIPSIASALVILLVLVRAGDRVFPQFGGVVAASVFGLNLMTPRLATLVRTDMLLTLFIFLTGFVIYEKVRTGFVWTTRERWFVFWLVLCSMLTKGPIAYAFLLPGLIAFALICKKRGIPSNAWSGWWTWFSPLLVFTAWALVGMRDREFYEQVVLKEFLGRFTVGEQAVHKNQPFYFYVTHVLRDFAPWSLLLIALPFVRDVRRALSDRAALWLVCWSIGGLIVMSLVPSKRPDRIFPIIPPLCLLLVYFLREMQTSGWRVKRLVVISTSIALLLSADYAIYNVIDSYREGDDVLVKFGNRVCDYAQQHALRYAIATSKDEGMLLYLRQPAFIKPHDAQNAWRDGKIDALVLNAQDFSSHADSFQPSFLADATGVGAQKNSHYFFLVRAR